MEVEQREHLLNAPAILTAVLTDYSAVTDYRTLRDSLPRRLSALLKCRSVLLYQRSGETLQFASGTFDDIPGWSSSLLSIAHINPIDLHSDLPEAQAWRARHATLHPPESAAPALVSIPLIYRQRATGVLVAFRRAYTLDEQTAQAAQSIAHKPTSAAYWSRSDLPTLEAVASIVALLLENTRLLERDRERIHELALLNSITSQLNCSLYETERVERIVIQRTREITSADLCELIRPDASGTTQEPSSWITPALRDTLLSHFTRQRESHLIPLIIERPGDHHDHQFSSYIQELPSNIKTFFAIPLLINDTAPHKYSYGIGKILRDSLSGHVDYSQDSPELVHAVRLADNSPENMTDRRQPKVLGVVVGAYHRVWKLRHEELVLLQVLTSQTSAVLENLLLMTEVVEARNEARKLLRQVLDDQRMKELILESVPSGLITIDLSGNITTFNRAAEAILGYHPYEALGQPLQKILKVSTLIDDIHRRGRASPGPANPGPANLNPENYSHEDETLQSPGDLSETIITIDRHGQEIALDVHLAPLYNDQHQQIGILATFADVTSMHRLEEEKRRLDRLASLGEMAASVAHEVRNPLASIKTSMQMLKNDLAGDVQDIDQAQESALVALKEVERLDAIVRDLLLFARPRQLHYVACNIVELSDHVLHIMQTQCAEAGVVIHRLYHDDVPLIQVDMAQMEQVLFNLYVNAVQAMPEGGILSVLCQVIQTNAAKHAHTRPDKHTPLSFGEPIGVYSDRQQWLEIAVSDTGVGIAPDQLERIFQPFFTTKAHGIGLGLPITRRLIEDHRGHILVESQLGYGATISVRLPCSSQ